MQWTFPKIEPLSEVSFFRSTSLYPICPCSFVVNRHVLFSFPHADQEISGDILLELTVDALKELKVNTFGKRFKLMNAINLLKKQNLSRSRNSQDFDEEEEALAREEEQLDLGDEEEEDGRLRDTKNRDTSKQHDPSGYRTDLLPNPQKHKPAEMTDSKSPNAANIEDDLVSNYNSVIHSRPLGHSNSINHFDRPISPGLNRARTVASISPSQNQNIPGQDANSRQRNVIYSPRVGNTQQSLAHVWNGNDKAESSTRNEALKSRSPPTAAAMASSAPTNGLRRQGSIMPGNRPTSPPANDFTPFRPEHQPFEKRGSLMPQPKPQGILPVATRYSVDGQRNMNDMTPDMEGWLHKQGDRYKTWNKRWFVLKGSNLFYFKSPRDIRMKGIINLRGYRVISDDSIMAGKWCFKTQHERERTFFFYCDTEEAMREWVKALMKATILRDYNGKFFFFGKRQSFVRSLLIALSLQLHHSPQLLSCPLVISTP
jgi:hypothetical protein